MDGSRFVPMRRTDLVKRLAEEDAMRTALQTLHHVLRFESDERRERLLESYAPFDPDPVVAGSAIGNADAFLESFEAIIEGANFRRVDDAELQAAFHERSLFPLAVHIDLSEYDVLALYRRGVGERTEKVRGASTLWRWKERKVRFYERLVVALRLRPEALVGSRATRTEGMEAGKIYLKSFKNIPTADVEMILPNACIALRPLDRLLIYGPLLGGVGWTAYQSLGVVQETINSSFEEAIVGGALQAIGGVLLVLVGYLWKTMNKIKTQRLRYMQTLSKGLYFRNLANNAAVLDQLLTFAQNEDEKEATIAFALLQDAPLRTKALDEKAEAWIKHETGHAMDFDVQDGIARLERLGLVRKKMGKWHAVNPVDAQRILDARWDSAF